VWLPCRRETEPGSARCRASPRDVEYYPTGTAVTLKEFAEGTRWIIAGIMEWDMKRVGHEASGT